MSLESVRVKMSAKLTTSGSSPICWCLAIPKTFVFEHEDLPRRLRLDLDEERTIICKFSDEGNLPSDNIGQHMWVTFSALWLGMMPPPTSKVSAAELDAVFDTERQEIRIVEEEYLRALGEAFVDQPVSAPKDPPGQHLEIFDKFRTRPRGSNVAPVKLAPKDPGAHPPARPFAHVPTTAEWTETNIRNLKALIRDLQSNRPDIVFQVINGIVVMRKQIYQEV